MGGSGNGGVVLNVLLRFPSTFSQVSCRESCSRSLQSGFIYPSKKRAGVPRCEATLSSFPIESLNRSFTAGGKPYLQACYWSMYSEAGGWLLLGGLIYCPTSGWTHPDSNRVYIPQPPLYSVHSTSDSRQSYHSPTDSGHEPLFFRLLISRLLSSLSHTYHRGRAFAFITSTLNASISTYYLHRRTDLRWYLPTSRSSPTKVTTIRRKELKKKLYTSRTERTIAVEWISHLSSCESSPTPLVHVPTRGLQVSLLHWQRRETWPQEIKRFVRVRAYPD